MRHRRYQRAGDNWDGNLELGPGCASAGLDEAGVKNEQAATFWRCRGRPSGLGLFRWYLGRVRATNVIRLRRTEVRNAGSGLYTSDYVFWPFLWRAPQALSNGLEATYLEP